MKSQKPYTNATFTKRVDHEAGRHHTQRAPAEPVKCSLCGAIYSERRWMSADEPEKSGTNKPWHPAETVVCPACKKQQERLPAGFVYLDGAFLSAHRDEIQRLLHNVAEQAADNNPLARIMNYEGGDGGQLIVTTTTEDLAQRLGHALEKAYKGEVRYDFSHENKLARVYWHRD
jgi:hypothetical protein